jgi:hypothetical protein
VRHDAAIGPKKKRSLCPDSKVLMASASTWALLDAR